MNTPTDSPAPAPRRSVHWGWLVTGGVLLLFAGFGAGKRAGHFNAGKHFASGERFRDHREFRDSRFDHRRGPGENRHASRGDDRRPSFGRGPERDHREGAFRPRPGPDGHRFGANREFLQEWLKPVAKIQEATQADLVKVLTPAQKETFSKFAAGPDHRQGPPLIGVILYRPRVDRLTEELKLSADQKRQVEALFKHQRDDVLAWLDKNPPPKPTARS